MIKPVLNKAIVAINGSSSSLKAAMYGIMLAKQYNIQLKAVYVVDTATLKYLSSSHFLVSEELNSYEINLNNDGKKYLDYVENLAKTKGIKIQTELRKGAVWSEIINAADEFESDLILLGGKDTKNTYVKDIHERRNINATAHSEIAEFAHCPVMIVHKQDVEDLFKIL